MNWWPAASDDAWTWGWQAFPGVWLFIALITGAYVAALRGPGRRRTRLGEPAATRRQQLYFVLGLVSLWLAIDWPLGLLGTGYSLAARIVQHMTIGFVATPLLLLGLPEWMASALVHPRRVRVVMRQLLRPWVASLLFDAVFLVSIVPPVVNGWQPTQPGSFAITLLWVVSGLLVWWPLVAPAGSFGRLGYLLITPYLFTQFLLPKIPAAYYIFSGASYYDLYRDAPRVWSDISPRLDQQIAGAIIWLVGGILIVTAIYVLMLRWQRDERMQGVVRDLGLPSSPRALSLLFEEPGAWEAMQRLASMVRGHLGETAANSALGLDFRVPEELTADTREQVVLEVRVALNPVEQLELWERIERGYTAYLETLTSERGSAVRRRVGFRVVEYEVATVEG